MCDATHLSAEPCGWCSYTEALIILQKAIAHGHKLDSLSFFFLMQRVRAIAAEPFGRCSYTEAVSILQKAIADGHKFENNEVEWGMDFGSEHERYLSEKVFLVCVVPVDICIQLVVVEVYTSGRAGRY